MAKQKNSSSIKSVQPSEQKINLILLCIALMVTAILYFPSLRNGLTNWDDEGYITNNPQIKQLSRESTAYHFKNYHMGNYHPLTMLSLSMDYKEPLSAKSFHLTNYFLHLINVALVFLFVFLLTRHNIIAFISTLLFALHPMHVESVAWASERKDVLYAAFFLGALCAYLKFLTNDKNKTKWYLLVSFLFICSLLSKGQAVVLPLILVLIDFFAGRKINLKSFAEKTPWFVASLIFGIVAIYAQRSISAIHGVEEYSFLDRIIFAEYGITAYLYKLIIPSNLSCFYPFPLKVSGTYSVVFYIAPAILMALVFLVWKYFRANKYVLFACFFFLVSVSIVLQLLPVGTAIIADRYTYIPYLGFFILTGKIFAYAFEKKISSALWRNVSLLLISCALCMFSYLTSQRIKVWKDSLTLWNDAISKSQTSPKPFLNRGKIYEDDKQYGLAIADFNKAIALKQDYAEAYYNRGLAYFFQKNYENAIADYTSAIKNNPALAVAWNNRSGTYFTIGKFKEALYDARKAQELGYAVDPKYVEVLQTEIKK